jgi:membrane protein
MTESPDGAKGGALAVAIAIAIYGASKGAGAIVTALNIAYEVKDERGFIQSTILSLAMTVGALAVLAVAVGAVAAMGWVEALFPGLPYWGHTVLRLLSWGFATVMAGLGAAAVYRFAPNRPDAPWVWISPGSAAATLFWLAASLGFGLYVSRFGNYNATYGSLGGVVVFLTWLYLSAYILLIGGEFNSELERQQAPPEGPPPTPAADEREEARAPMPEGGGGRGWAFALAGLLLVALGRPPQSRDGTGTGR